MPDPSTILITYDGDDITSDVIFSSASFEQNANATPGQFRFQVTDKDELHDFEIGKEITLTVDGDLLFGGILLITRKTYAFSVVDTTDLTKARKLRVHELQGSDYNIWFDKRVLRNESDYKNAITLSGPLYDGEVIRSHLDNYFDIPAGIDLDSEVDDVARVGLKGTFAFPTQGSTWRQVMEDLRARSGATYFIGADKKLHWHAVARTKHSWGLTDKPGAPSLIGARDISATQDGSQMVTDALIWTGNEIFAEDSAFTPEGSGLFFTRFPDAPANTESVDGITVWTAAQEQRGIDLQDQWGVWQAAETHFGEGNSPEKGALRARYLVTGPSGSIYGVEGGLGQPLWNFQMTWFGHDVPSGDHIPAGYLVDLVLYVMGEDSAHPLIQLLPLRHSVITFPTIPENPTGFQAYVQFTGQFGIDYSDHRKLWKAMRNLRRESVQEFGETGVQNMPSPYTDSDVENSTYRQYGAFVRVSATSLAPSFPTVFTTGVPFIAGTARVWMNGLFQRPFIEYEEDPSGGQIEFYVAPLATDQVYVEARAAGEL